MMNEIALYKVEHGLSLRDIAEKVGISKTAVAAHCKGEKNISAETALLYERWLGIPRWRLRPDLWKEGEGKNG